MRWIVFLLLTVASFCSVLGRAYAVNTERFALVIGNQNYQLAPLQNTLNDAEAISDAFFELGFRVTTLTDANFLSLQQGINRFYDEVDRAPGSQKLAVVYYAGHAIQINHANYLIPLNIQFESEQEFVGQLYNLSHLFELMNKTKKLQNIVILDACRNNPFEGSAFSSQGLAPVKAPAATLIAFATEPGGVASDGKSENGVYTKHLLKYISESISIEEIFKKVRSAVAKETRNRQIPWEHSSLLGEVYFSPPKNKEVPNIVVF
ncbi:caspase family protein [Aliiglaciecola sp. 3_MG-2023]|uniref:caspase family protein n=1 Tax=Aliiglaciecola sp. 3_MG-2023 TaxID=3062644 RepID=UPI0026E46642|nr:caspase family protein [Aliiglaciecola sp. 3_MG-2023]MDO6695516.1 caspase family protein [Aliiglaciecola sp. 3_MG-2023]